MSRSTRITLGLALALAPAAFAQRAAADPPREVGLSLGAGPQATGVLEPRFTPSLPNHPEATGSAGQDVRLAGRTGDAVAAALTRMVSRSVGVQLVAAAARSPLGGPSGDYAWSLSYTARQPPNYQPQPVEANGSTPWPAADGELRHLALAANVLVRYPAAERVALSFSAGLAVQRVAGDISPLGVTLFSEGGHAVLFSDTYRVRVALQPATVVGVDVGTEFGWRLSPRFSLALEIRYFAAPSTRVEARVDRVLNDGEVIRQATPAELNAQAPLRGVDVDPSFGAAWAGIRYRF